MPISQTKAPAISTHAFTFAKSRLRNPILIFKKFPLLVETIILGAKSWYAMNGALLELGRLERQMARVADRKSGEYAAAKGSVAAARASMKSVAIRRRKGELAFAAANREIGEIARRETDSVRKRIREFSLDAIRDWETGMGDIQKRLANAAKK